MSVVRTLGDVHQRLSPFKASSLNMAKSAKRKAPFAAAGRNARKEAEPNPFEKGHGKQKFNIIGRKNLSAAKNINKARSEAIDKVWICALQFGHIRHCSTADAPCPAAQEDAPGGVQAAEEGECVR